MNKKDESIKRVSVQAMVYPYVKELLEERAGKVRRSVSSIAEEILTKAVGKQVASNGKPGAVQGGRRK